MTALEQVLAGVPPEKYYEACITYHLVREAERRGWRLYPFSISQVLERQWGFDFGYDCAGGQVFLAQYKRPIRRSNGWQWTIDREQFWTLRRCGLPTYYALPGFFHASEWYEGMDHTIFLSVSALEPWMLEQGEGPSACLDRRDPILRQETPAAALFPGGLGRVQAGDAARQLSLTGEQYRMLSGLTDVVGYWLKEREI